MKALKAYIYSDPDKYFNGRYDIILQSIKSDSEKGRIVDNAKLDIKNAYNGLYGGSSSIIEEFINYVKNAASANNSIFFDETAFRFELSSIFTNPSSGFRYQTNKFDTSFGDDSKDDFDFITNSYDILNLRKNASLYKSDLTTEEDGKTVSQNINKAYDDLVSQKIDTQKTISSYSKNIRYYNSIISAFNKSRTSSKEEIAKAEDYLSVLNDRLQKLIDNTNKTAEEYYSNVAFANAFKVLVPASCSQKEVVTSNMKMPVLMSEALLFVAYIGIIVVGSIVSANKKKKENTADNLIETDDKTSE